MAAYSETIIDAIVAALEGITETGGYSMTLVKVQRYDRRDITSGEKPCIHVIKGEESKELVGAGWDVTLTLDLDCYIFEDENDIRSTDELQALAQWDIEQALTGVDWSSLNADLVACDAIGFAVEDPEGAVEDGVLVTATITYRLSEHDMTTPI